MIPWYKKAFVIVCLPGAVFSLLPSLNSNPVVHHAIPTTTVVVKQAPSVVVVTTTTMPLELTRWDTRSYDSTATWPDASDPTWKLPLLAQETFACIRYKESRNHSFSVEINSHAAGWYQIMPHIWWYASQYIAGLPTSPELATTDQQSTVAVWYYKRNNGFLPEWQDGC